ncbi:hypothetical protein PIB30_083984 [Stylosanthes scabra]|uniref:FHA domain-containing protein n=1 Tax=Stylosanthes scabra TaxID=79078 RepID=A0ABU6XRU4_9FABA|nr:hypothetical protein [Stylosanthes scabra]
MDIRQIRRSSVPLSGVDLIWSRDSDLAVSRPHCLFQPGSHAPRGPGDETARNRPVDLVNVDAFLTTTGRDEDIWWPTHRTTRAWYESWMVVIQIVPELDFRGNRELFRQTSDRHPPSPLLISRSRLMRRLVGIVEEGGLGIHEALFVGRGRLERRHRPHRERYEDESEEEKLLDQFESLGDFAIRHSSTPPPPPPQPTDQQTHPDVVHDPPKASWEQLTSARLDDVWDVMRTSASAAHDITQGFRQRTELVRGSSGVNSFDLSVGYHQMPPHPSMQFHTTAPYPHPQRFHHFQQYSHDTYEQAGLSYSSQPAPQYQHYSDPPPRLSSVILCNTPIFMRKKEQKERKERKKMRVVVVVPPSGGRNFYTGAPIDAPFAATRSSRLPLRFYPNN